MSKNVIKFNENTSKNTICNHLKVAKIRKISMGFKRPRVRISTLGPKAERAKMLFLLFILWKIELNYIIECYTI